MNRFVLISILFGILGLVSTEPSFESEFLNRLGDIALNLSASIPSYVLKLPNRYLLDCIGQSQKELVRQCEIQMMIQARQSFSVERSSTNLFPKSSTAQQTGNHQYQSVVTKETATTTFIHQPIALRMTGIGNCVLSNLRGTTNSSTNQTIVARLGRNMIDQSSLSVDQKRIANGTLENCMASNLVVANNLWIMTDFQLPGTVNNLTKQNNVTDSLPIHPNVTRKAMACAAIALVSNGCFAPAVNRMLALAQMINSSVNFEKLNFTTQSSSSSLITTALPFSSSSSTAVSGSLTSTKPTSSTLSSTSSTQRLSTRSPSIPSQTNRPNRLIPIFPF